MYLCVYNMCVNGVLRFSFATRLVLYESYPLLSLVVFNVVTVGGGGGGGGIETY